MVDFPDRCVTFNNPSPTRSQIARCTERSLKQVHSAMVGTAGQQ